MEQDAMLLVDNEVLGVNPSIFCPIVSSNNFFIVHIVEGSIWPL